MTAALKMKIDRLIVVEGPENTGKTSLSEALVKNLEVLGSTARYISFPGRGTASVGAIVYEIEHNPNKYGLTNLRPNARQALHLAAHLDAIENHIKPALMAGHWVVLDRYWWSMWAHGTAQGLSESLLGHLLLAEADSWFPIKPLVIFSTLRAAPWTEEASPEWHNVAKAYAKLIAEQEKLATVVALDPNADLDTRLDACIAWLRARQLIPII